MHAIADWGRAKLLIYTIMLCFPQDIFSICFLFHLQVKCFHNPKAHFTTEQSPLISPITVCMKIFLLFLNDGLIIATSPPRTIVTASNVFQPLPNAFSPQERMVLQTSGQLQRLLSAFFNAPSRVEILYNDIVPYQSSPFLSDDEDESVSNVTTTDILNDHQEGLTTNTRKDTPSSSKLDMCFERKICMYFGDRMAYEAESMVIPRTSETLDLLAVHHYGLGQIFA